MLMLRDCLGVHDKSQSGRREKSGAIINKLGLADLSMAFPLILLVSYISLLYRLDAGDADAEESGRNCSKFTRRSVIMDRSRLHLPCHYHNCHPWAADYKATHLSPISLSTEDPISETVVDLLSPMPLRLKPAHHGIGALRSR